MEVPVAHDRCLPRRGEVQHLPGDERVAIAVAADPGAELQQRPDAAAGQLRPSTHGLTLDIAVQLR